MDSKELKSEMLQLTEPVTDAKPPYWDYWRRELWKHVMEGENPAQFSSWPCIYHTMLVNHWADSVAGEFKELEADDSARWRPVFRPTIFDRPARDLHDQKFARILIHQAYHLHQWERITGLRIEDQGTIVEFGGGFGAMALVCKRLGFEGDYFIYDYPEFSLLQEYYLSQLGVGGITWLPEIEPLEADLMIANYSLSECPLKTRRSWLKAVKAKSHLFLYSAQWTTYDNVKFFQDEVERKHLALVSRDWYHQEALHLPDRGNWYSIGH